MPAGSQQGRNINEASVVRQGLATAALQDGASSGDAATIGPNGALLFAAGGGGSQSLVDLGVINFVDLLSGPQTLYTPAVGEFVQITLTPDGYVEADGGLAFEVSDAPTTRTDLVALHDQNFSYVRNTIPPGIVRSGEPITAALYQNVSALIVPSLSPAWQTNHAYAAGALITGPDNHLWSSSGGTSAGSIPDFAGNEAGTVVDNTVTWQDEGAIPTHGSIHLYAQVII